MSQEQLLQHARELGFLDEDHVLELKEIFDIIDSDLSGELDISEVGADGGEFDRGMKFDVVPTFSENVGSVGDMGFRDWRGSSGSSCVYGDGCRSCQVIPVKGDIIEGFSIRRIPILLVRPVDPVPGGGTAIGRNRVEKQQKYGVCIEKTIFSLPRSCTSSTRRNFFPSPDSDARRFAHICRSLSKNEFGPAGFLKSVGMCQRLSVVGVALASVSFPRVGSVHLPPTGPPRYRQAVSLRQRLSVVRVALESVSFPRVGSATRRHHVSVVPEDDPQHRVGTSGFRAFSGYFRLSRKRIQLRGRRKFGRRGRGCRGSRCWPIVEYYGGQGRAAALEGDVGSVLVGCNGKFGGDPGRHAMRSFICMCSQQALQLYYPLPPLFPVFCIDL